MNYSKYNKKSFIKLCNNTEALEKLTSSLQDDVLEESNQEIKKAFGKVVSKLDI